MSDPVTNAEVEDVLSSIRRLVSEDKRPLQAKISLPANDRLVLTPALRVADMPEDTVPNDEAAEEAVEEAIAQNTAALSDNEELSDDLAHDYAADPYNFADDADLDGEDDEKEVLSLAEDERDADQASEEHDDDDRDHIDDNTRQDDQEPATQDALEASDASNKIDNTPQSSPATLSAKIAALETAIGNIADTWEPDAVGADDYSGTEAPAMAWEDEVERDATGAPFDLDDDDADDVTNEAVPNEAFARQDAPQPERMASAEQSAQDTSDQDGLAYGADDQLLDEEALRDLVSDIVRSELQGALGERITRNVRKLVRREIHRALTAQELE